MSQNQRIRTRLIFAAIVLFAFVLISSLYSKQILKGKEYFSKAEAQYAKPTNSLFDRGTIYFETKEHGRIAAATIEHGNLVYLNPKQVAQTKETYEALSQFIKVNESAYTAAVKNKSLSYIELAHKVEEDKLQSITALQLPGIHRTTESWRSYPGGALAAQTLGIVGEDSSTSTIRGKYGLERTYENILSRKSSSAGSSIFAELFSVSGAFSSEEAEGDIVTTIEPTVQGYLEKILEETSGVWHPDEIGGIIMNPKNGEIIALGSLPTFNGNDTTSVKNPKVFSNPLVEHVYEMGSIMKPLTMAIGLDTKVISPKSTYDDTGTMTLNGKKISNFDGRARGITSMQNVLSESLNIGAATIALKVGGPKLIKYFTDFGFGQKTGIDLPNEATGLIKNLNSEKEIEIATASYGQGIAVSPVEMITALSTLANGGFMISPHLVKEIDYTDGTKEVTQTAKGKKVLSDETVKSVTAMLVKVVDEALKKGKIKNLRYTVAAKTGTAQIPDHSNGGYYDDRYLHSFFGYFPAYDPEFIVFLYQIHPKGAQYASETLTDPFDNLSKFLLNYYNIAPDR